MGSMAQDAELIKEFLNETNELLDNLDNDLVSLESNSEDNELINRIFRAFHTIKGTSSFLGFDQLVELGHAAEDVLSLIRDGERKVTSEVLDTLLDSTDKLKILVDQIRDNDIKKIDLTKVLSDLNKIKSGEVSEKTEESSEVIDEGSEKQTDEKQIKSEQDDLKVSKNKEVKRDRGDRFKNTESSTIRVDVERLDDLMNLVGELVLERNRLLQVSREFRIKQDWQEYEEKMAETTEKINFITGELQLSVLKMRMVPIDRLFKKYPRLIRDIARDKKKKVELVITGGETELDKTVIDLIGDPLVHLMRNAIDHGIESPEVRQKRGKPRTGKIELSASQEGNHIIIMIKDDGGGIDIEKVKKKALEKKIATEAQIKGMSDTDAIQLIFEPGFSTADQVSDLSGRGVGMDVVRNNIRNLNGIIDVQSEYGKGSTFILKLPLTLAVIQALVVKVAKEIYAVPLASVVETIRISEQDIQTIDHKEVIRHRDSVIPVLYLDRLFNVIRSQDEYETSRKIKYVVLIAIAEKRYGLIVDHLLGQEEVVIKSLGDYLGNVPGIAGGTITGDGRVRLILDTANVADIVQKQSKVTAVTVE
ncbi:chemotaxis protein CheA [candidate division KSB1 bacterium]|nr:MAG: chemotaxis protein CheA [candidate division KSB1 bacterium]